MELEKIESRRVGDYYYKVRHPSGLDIYLYPKEIGRSTRAVFAVRYGSVDNCFQGEGEAAPTEMPLGIAHADKSILPKLYSSPIWLNSWWPMSRSVGSAS